MRLGDHDRRRVRAEQIAAVDGADRSSTQVIGEGVRLLDALGIERNIAVSLPASFDVPISLPMPDQQYSLHVHLSGLTRRPSGGTIKPIMQPISTIRSKSREHFP